MGTVEKLKRTEQSVIFLNRCKKSGICPSFLRNPIRFPREIEKSPSAIHYQQDAEVRILKMLVRNEHRTIRQLKITATRAMEKLHCHPKFQTLQELVNSAGSASKTNSKNNLKRKYTKLTTGPREGKRMSPDIPGTFSGTNPGQPPQSTDIAPAATVTAGDFSRISTLGDVQVSAPAVSLLAKGPKFAITPKITKDGLQERMQTEVAVLAYGLRWQAAIPHLCTGFGADVVFEPMKGDCPFNVKRREPPRDNIEVEKKIRNFTNDMERILRSATKQAQRITPNTTRKEREAVQALRERDDVLITRSDKGGEMVVMKVEDMQRACKEHLGDANTYTKLQKDPTPTLRLEINKALQRILEERQFPKILVRRLQTPPNARTQEFYALPKTHKKGNSLKIRPIVSGSGGIFERIGWLLQYIFKPLLQEVQAHIGSTKDLLRRFKHCNRNELQGKIPISFDVVSLYTNIGIQEATETVLDYAQRYKINTYTLTSADLKELLDLILLNNVFRHPDIGIFRQIRGLAMGSKLSGTLAIIVMDRFERAHITELTPPLPVYVRYVDDSGTAVDSSDSARLILDKINKKHPTIKFELELPDEDGFLPILDLKIKILPDGQLTHKLYTKPANKGITLHANSHHPRAVKAAVIGNEFKRAVENSTPNFEQISKASITSKLLRNGYTTEQIARANGPARRRRETQSKRKLVLKVPYISDKANGQIRAALRKNKIDARLVNPRPRTVLELGKKRRKMDGCKMRNCPTPYLRCCACFVVYEVTCQLCKEKYIGSTTRQIHTRASEHLQAARKHDHASAMGEHYAKSHPAAAPNLSFAIIQTTEQDELRLRIAEAYAIKTRKPKLNRRLEDLGTGFLA